MPHLSLLFARRYLFSKKSHSVINVISGVSAVAVAVPVMAMVILLSVFNGFEGLIRDMYKSFDPDILITPSSGKVFDTDSVPQQRLAEVPGVEAWSFSLEENALFEYRDRQYIGVMRGVDSLFATVVPIDSLLTEGRYRLRFGELPEVRRARRRLHARHPDKLQRPDFGLRPAPGTVLVFTAAKHLPQRRALPVGHLRTRSGSRR